MRCENGIVVWEGPSRFDKKSPVVVYLQYPGMGNKKIGFMAQAWIFRADMKPIDAVSRRLDRAICGACPRAGGNKCYVTTHRLVNLWNAIPFCERVSPEIAGRRLAGMKLRIGAYGDPAAVPSSVWRTLTKHTIGHTGYTHSPAMVPDLRGKIMASADSAEDAARWQKLGWKTYRIRNWDKEGNLERLLPGEMECPADEHSKTGKKMSCADCLACGSIQRKSVTIREHSGVTMSRLAKLWAKHPEKRPQKKSVSAEDIMRGALDQVPDVEVAKLLRRYR